MSLPFLLALAVAAQQPQAERQPPPAQPSVDHLLTSPGVLARTVLIEKDTVWFATGNGDRTGGPAVAFVRRTGAWLATSRSAAAWRAHAPADTIGRPPHGRLSYWHHDDTVALVDGFALLDTVPWPDPRPALDRNALSAGLARPRYNLRTPTGATHELRVKVTGARRRALFEHTGWTLRPGEVPPPFTTDISAWAAGRGSLFFGLAGGMARNTDSRPHGYDEYLGGVLQYGIATRRVVPLLHPLLAAQVVRDMVVAGGSLWLTTYEYSVDYAVYTGDYDPDCDGPEGVGLLRYDLATRAWRRIARDSVSERSPLPDNNVLDLAAAGDTLWLATCTGVAALDTRTGASSVRYYRDTLVTTADGADTTVTMLVAARPRPRPIIDDSAVWGIATLAKALDLRHRRRFLAAARALPPEPFVAFDSAYKEGSNQRYEPDTPFRWGDSLAVVALSHPSLAPFLREAVRTDSGHDVAAAALVALGAEQWRSAMYAALDSAPARVAARAADALRARGDPAGAAWVHARLRDPRMIADTADESPPLSHVLMLVGGWKDPAHLPALLALLRTPHAYDAMRALRRYESAQVDRRMYLAMADAPPMWPFLLWQASSDSLPLDRDPEMRTVVVRLSLRVLALSDSAWRALVPWSLNRYPQVSAATIQLGGTEAAGRLRDAAFVPALIASLEADTTWWGHKHGTLVNLTGADSAPPPHLGGPRMPAYERARAFWRAWRRAHPAGFTPLGKEAGDRASDRWVARWRRAHQ